MPLPPTLTPCVQLSALTKLRELELGSCCSSPAGFWPLAHLSALSRLDLTGAPLTLPGRLGSNSSLCMLTLDIDPDTLPAHAVDDFLATDSLQGLTHLQLPFTMEQAPACLAAMTRLHSLYLGDCEQPGAALPPGDWLHGLRRLVLPVGLLEDRLPALAAAQRLERLGLLDVLDPWDIEPLWSRLPRILRWAARQPCLRLLALELDTRRLAWCQEELQQAHQEHPALCIECMCYRDVAVRVFR